MKTEGMFDESVYVAYHGFAYLKGAVDSHKTGLQIQLVLDREEDYQCFKSFKKHRKGKAGSGMYRCLSRREGLEDWYGPVDLLFKRWSISSVHGAVVTFELSDEEQWRLMRDSEAIDSGYRIDELTPTEFVLAELTEDGKPVNVEQRAKLEKMARKQKWPKGGPQSKRAARLCGDVDFYAFLLSARDMTEVLPLTNESVAEWMRKEIGIDTRAQLDHDQAALDRFEDRIMKPFLRSQM